MSNELTAIKIRISRIAGFVSDISSKGGFSFNQRPVVMVQENPNTSSFYIYMVEIFTKPGTASEVVREHIGKTTGMMPLLYMIMDYGKTSYPIKLGANLISELIEYVKN